MATAAEMSSSAANNDVSRRSVSTASMSSDGSNGGSGRQAATAAPNANAAAAAAAAAAGTTSISTKEAEMTELTTDVKNFKEALSRLRRVFSTADAANETLRVASHEQLGKMLAILKEILEKYPALQANDLVQSAGYLINLVKDFSSDDELVDDKDFHAALSSLAFTFSHRVSEYLTSGGADLESGAASSALDSLFIAEDQQQQQQHHQQQHALQHQHQHHHLQRGSAIGTVDMLDDRMSPPNPGTILSQQESTTLTNEEVDGILLRHFQGVDHALKYAKMWAKYAKDVMNYVEKRTNLELERARGLAKLAQATRPILTEESHLPFQSIYCTAIDQELEMCASTQETCVLLQGYKFLEPLFARRQEHQKARKALKEKWSRDLKVLQDTVGNLKKAKALYTEKGKEFERCREAVRLAEHGAEIGATGENKVERRKKSEEEALQKLIEAESLYKSCVSEANEKHRQLLAVKASVLASIRELVLQCDQTVKAVTVSYFQLQHSLAANKPIHFQTLCERSRLYEPGTQYVEFVRCNVGDQPQARAHFSTGDPFRFEPYSEDGDQHHHPGHRRTSQDIGAEEMGSGSYRYRGDRSSPSSGAVGTGPIMAWAPSIAGPMDPVSDTDSDGSKNSRDTSPSASPMIHSRNLPSGPAGSEDADNDHDAQGHHGSAGSGSANASASGAQRRSWQLSMAAKTHRFRKLKTPSKCRECENLVWTGVDCQDCGLSAHKKCLEVLALQCGHKRLPRKTQTFGVDLSQHLQETGGGAQVPPLVCRCVHEIDKRGLHVKGIYRVPPVKHRSDKLCQAFENAPELVELTDIHPNVIANVLKQYLLQLPEPLITFNLFPELIRLAKRSPGKEIAAAAAAAAAVKDENDNREEDSPPPPLGSGPVGHAAGADDDVVSELQILIRTQLPAPHFRTLGFLMHHLLRVAKESEVNNMWARNLATVLGPTLMRSSDGLASLSSLGDTDHQVRIIELLVIYADDIFGNAESVLPKDYAKYTAPSTSRMLVEGQQYSKHGKQSKISKSKKESIGGGGGMGPTGVAGAAAGAAAAGGGSSSAATSTSSDLISSQTERRSLETQEEYQGLPGQISERESANEDYLSYEDDDDAEAIPSCWLPDDSSKTKKSPLLNRGTSAPPKIIKASLKSFSGLEGVTPERLSTQDSVEAAQKLAKQASADVVAVNSSSRRSIPHESSSIRHHRPSEGLFAKVGRAGKKHSLDEDYLSPPVPMNSSHAPLSERLSTDPPVASSRAFSSSSSTSAIPHISSSSISPPLQDAKKSDEVDGSGSISTATSGSGRTSLTIGIGGQQPPAAMTSTPQQGRSSSLSDDHAYLSVSEQRRKFLAASSSADSSQTTVAAASASTSTSMSASLPSTIPNIDENRVKIQVTSGVVQTSSSQHVKKSTVIKQTSIEKGSLLFTAAPNQRSTNDN